MAKKKLRSCPADPHPSPPEESKNKRRPALLGRLKKFSVSKYSSFTFELSSRMYFFQDVCITATQMCTRIMPIGHKLLLITAWASGWQNLFFDTDFLEKTFSYFILLNQKRIELIFIISLLQFWSAKRLRDLVFVCLVIKPQRQSYMIQRLTRLSNQPFWGYPDQRYLDRGTQIRVPRLGYPDQG